MPHVLAKINSISPVEKHRLIKKGVIGTQFSTDENFLRLRHYHCPLSAYVYKVGFNFDNCDDPRDVDIFREVEYSFVTDALFSSEAYKILGIVNSRTEASLTVPNVSMTQETAGVYLQLSNVLFDVSNSAETLLSAANICTDSSRRLRSLGIGNFSVADEQYLSQYDSNKGLFIKHPDCEEGINRSKLLLITQSDVIRKFHKSSIDYNSLDFRKVLSHKSFNLLQHLNTHPNNQHLKEFLSSGGSYDALVTIYNKSI